MKVAGVIYNELRKTPNFPSEGNRDSDKDGTGGNRRSCGSTKTAYDLKRSADNSRESENNKEVASPPRRLYMQPNRVPDPDVKQQGNNFFRRTQIPRTKAVLQSFERQIALEALEMTDPDLMLYPDPSEENCMVCEFRKPCIAMYEGFDAEELLEAEYRKRTGEEAREVRIGGSTWSVDRGAIPPNFGEGN